MADPISVPKSDAAPAEFTIPSAEKKIEINLPADPNVTPPGQEDLNQSIGSYKAINPQVTPQFDTIPSQESPLQEKMDDGFDSVIANIKGKTSNSVKQNMFVAQDIPSEREADVIKLADRFKTNPDFIRNNYDDFARKAGTPSDSELAGLLKSNPKLTKFISESPSNAALVKDDIPAQSEIEGVVDDFNVFQKLGSLVMSAVPRTVSNAIKTPAFLTETMNLVLQNLPQSPGDEYGGVNPETITGERPVKNPLGIPEFHAPEIMRKNAATIALDDASREWLAKVPEMNTASIEEIRKGNIKKGALGLTYQLLSGAPDLALMSIDPLLVVQQSLARGAETSASAIESGVDPGVATMAGLVHSATFEAMGHLKLAAMKPWEDALTKTYGQAVSWKVMQAVGSNLAYHSLTMAGAQSVTHAGDQFADFITEINPNALDKPFEQTLNQIVSGGLLGLATGGIGAIRSVHSSAAQAEMTRDTYMSLQEKIDSTKLFKKLPDIQKKIVTEMTKNGPLENIYIRPEAIDSYCQEKKIDPVEFMQKMGKGKEYSEAKESGTHVKIPTADWATRFVGTEHYEGLKDDIKFYTEVDSVNESKEKEKEIKATNDVIIKTLEKIKSTPVEQRSDEEARLLGEQMQADLEKVPGISKSKAKAVADATEAFYRTQGVRFETGAADIAKTVPVPRFVDGELQPPQPGEIPEQKTGTYDQGRASKETVDAANKADADSNRLREELVMSLSARGETFGRKTPEEAAQDIADGKITDFSSYPEIEAKAKEFQKAHSDFRELRGKIKSEVKSYDQTEQNASPFFLRSEQVVNEKMGNSATPEQINGMLKDIKPEERKWLGIDEFLKGKKKVSKEELLAHLRGNELKIEEVVKSAEQSVLTVEPSEDGKAFEVVDDAGTAIASFDHKTEAEDFIGSKGGETKFSDSNLQLPGGENYREVLFRLPEKPPEFLPNQISPEEKAVFEKLKQKTNKNAKEWDKYYELENRQNNIPVEKGNGPDTYQSSHFDESNVLAHTRLNDRVDSEGKRNLFVEEIQSDWHQAGRKRGYDTGEKVDHYRVVSEGKDEFGNEMARGQTNSFSTKEEAEATLNYLKEQHGDKNYKIETVPTEIGKGGVPDAPFKKTWHEFVLKRLIREAAEKGYDKLSWTTGEQQAERYDLSKQVEAIRVERNKDGSYGLEAKRSDSGDFVVLDSGVSKEKLDDVIGKDLAEKVRNQKSANKTYSGVDLKVGGEGMKGFYDKILVDFANKFGKKYGAKVEDSNIVTEASKGQGEIEERNGYYHVMIGGEDVSGPIEGEQEAEDFKSAYSGAGADTGSTKTVHSLPITPELKQAALEEGFSLFQKDQGNPLGRADFYPDGQTIISMFKGANAATAIHEPAHFYLNAVERLVARPDAPQQLKDDLQVIRDHLGTKDGEKISVPQHEKFAEMVTDYFKNGVAPSERLKGVFQRFKQWLTTLFRKSPQYFNNEEIPVPVKEVLDRLFATQSEIEAAQVNQNMNPLFEFPAEVGMKPDEADKYSKAINQAKSAAEEELSGKLFKELKHQHSEEWKAEKEKIKSEMAPEIDKRQEQVALSALQNGTLPDGEPLPDHMKIKIDRQSIVDEFGKDRLKELPKPYVYKKEGGVPLDAAADAFGYDSGDALLTALSKAEPRDSILERMAQDKMKELHGDMMTDGQLNDLAIAAVHNHKSSDLMQKELEHLASDDFAKFKGLTKKIARRPLPLDEVRAQAQDQVDRSLYKDIQPGQFQRAEAKSGKEAMDAFLKGDFEAAFDAKKRQLLAHELYRISSDSKEKVDKFVDYMKRFSKTEVRKKLGLAGGNYLEQIDSILERFDFKKGVSLSKIENRKSLVDFVQAQHDKGFDVQVPQKLLDESFKQHYKDTSIEDIRDIESTVKNIAALASLKTELLANKKFKDFESAKKSVIGSIAAHHEIKDVKFDHAPGFKDRFIKKVDFVAASHTRMEFLFNALDGYKDHGPVWESMFLPFAEAEDHESILMRKANKDIRDIVEVYPKKERANWYSKKTLIPEIGQSWNKATLLSFLLNMGNAENIKAVQEGEGWTDAQMAAIKKLADARDWKFAQNIWDHVDTYWPMIESMEKRLNGLAPEKVEAQAFTNEHGSFKGGYYPLRFNGERSNKAATFELKGDIHDMLGGSYSRAATKKGHTVEREGSGGLPVKLELGVLTEHLTNVIHDLSHREAVIDSHKMINDPEIRAAVEGSLGTEAYKQLNPWLRAIAGEKRTDSDHILESFFSHIRGGATIVNLGWKFTSGLKHTLSYTMATKELGPKYALSGIRDVFSPTNPMKIKEAYDFVVERSDVMKRRFEDSDRDIRDAQKKMNISGIEHGVLSVPDFYLEDVKHSYFKFMGHMDLATSLPSWMGAYRKAMDGKMENIKAGDEKAAIEYADSLVRTTKGAGAAKDLARVQRGNDSVKMFTMFYSQMAIRYNNVAKVAGEYKMYKNVPNLIAGLALTWFVPAVLEQIVIGRGPSLDDKKKALEHIAKDEIKYPLESIVGLRDLVNATDKRNPQFSPVLDAVVGGVHAYQSLTKGDHKLNRYDLNNAVNTAGYFLHLPTRQALQTGEYIHDWMTGVEKPSNPMEGVWQALVTGHQRKE